MARQKKEEAERHERMMQIMAGNPQMAYSMQATGLSQGLPQLPTIGMPPGGGGSNAVDQSGNPYASRGEGR